MEHGATDSWEGYTATGAAGYADTATGAGYGTSGGVQQRAQQLGLELADEAVQQLATLPEAHAYELLDATAAKFAGGTLSSPSNYICAAIRRGYVPQADGGAARAAANAHGSWHEGGVPRVQAPAVAAGPPAAPVGVGDPTALALCTGMQKAQEAGLALTEEALQALLTIPTAHASELLEHVATKAGTLRDPSNFIGATIARGYVSRVDGTTSGGESAKGSGKSVAKGGGKGAWGDSQVAGKGAWSDSGGVKGGSAGNWGDATAKGGWGEATPVPVPQLNVKGAGGTLAEGATSLRQILIPDDVTPVESKLLEMNGAGLFLDGQKIEAESLIALRCLPTDQALELLVRTGEKAAKGNGKGISNPNNYIQAAIAKIRREQFGVGNNEKGGGAGASYGKGKGASYTLYGPPAGGKGGSWQSSGYNHTGNVSMQRAMELGLNLDDGAQAALAAVPLKAAMEVLDAAAQQVALGQDPNDYILRASGAKRQRIM